MEPSEERIKELMTTVTCAVCGARYRHGSIEVLGHREALWFLRVSCTSCSSNGLVAAMIKPAEDALAQQSAAASEQEASDEELDRARAPGPVTRGEVARMRHFLNGFDGDFQTLFGPRADSQPPGHSV
jgi:hypothetical protein